MNFFYGRLFAADPRLRALFPPEMTSQRDRLFHALARIVWSQDNPAELRAYLSRLGRGHRKYGVLPEHYAVVGEALVATLRAFAAETWTAEAEAAWTAAFAAAADTMIEAAERDAATSPPWWVAEVADHDRRAADLAVLTLRPGRPLPFAPGQHVPVQAARWPRVWRPYSIANAPRPDGTLRLHVRAQPCGWVSGALVRHTTAGDTVLLGPAAGTMALDLAEDRDLLLVAGGTGLAPLKAIVEQVVMSGRAPRVHLLVGARSERDLYDLPDLRALEAAHPWLTVVPVLSESLGYDGMRGLVADVLDRFDGWEGHEAYVAGPVAMVRRTVTSLQELGVPPERIHHDLTGGHEIPVPAAGTR
ncbi:globin domain-containing protein [Actinomadura roseirufa]|uniref:globin domain-containing protein n=1 Tax=Actinomadura roseirufa TaxID=2094049 RepID=UPI001F5EF6F3|nr:globin domain-containing protein [Actinomadura roseirufa]